MSNQKRSFKFYRDNEADVMKSLGLRPTPNSGSGWIVKEDGVNDFVICQLKSTDAQSIKVNQKDLRILEYNASVEHKIPVFAIQFLNNDETWLLVKPLDLQDVSEFLKTGKIENDILGIDLECSEESKVEKTKTIKSSGNARANFHNEKAKKYNKIKSAR